MNTHFKRIHEHIKMYYVQKMNANTHFIMFKRCIQAHTMNIINQKVSNWSSLDQALLIAYMLNIAHRIRPKYWFQHGCKFVGQGQVPFISIRIWEFWGWISLAPSCSQKDAPGVLNSKESDIARRELSKESQLGSKLSFLMFDRTLGPWGQQNALSQWLGSRSLCAKGITRIQKPMFFLCVKWIFLWFKNQCFWIFESRNQCFWIFLDIQMRCFKSECQTRGLIWTAQQTPRFASFAHGPFCCGRPGLELSWRSFGAQPPQYVISRQFVSIHVKSI